MQVLILTSHLPRHCRNDLGTPWNVMHGGRDDIVFTSSGPPHGKAVGSSSDPGLA